jgi:hypothetical protein
MAHADPPDFDDISYEPSDSIPKGVVDKLNNPSESSRVSVPYCEIGALGEAVDDIAAYMSSADEGKGEAYEFSETQTQVIQHLFRSITEHEHAGRIDVTNRRILSSQLDPLTAFSSSPPASSVGLEGPGPG